MSIKFRCPQCHKVLSAPEEYAGGSATCKQCRAKIAIPTPEAGDAQKRRPAAKKATAAAK